MTFTQNPIKSFLDSLLSDLNFLITDPIGFLDFYFFSAPGYNLYNTFIYMIVGLLLIFLIGKIIGVINQKGFERWGEDNFIPVQMDQEFFIAILPYIFIGSSLRALNDIAVEGKIIFPYDIFADRIFVTPGVYLVTIILTMGIGIASIIISQEFLKDSPKFSNWRKTFFIVGAFIELVLIIPFIPLLIADLSFFISGVIIIGLTLIFGGGFTFTTNKYSDKFLPEAPIRREEKLAMITQMFDAFNTVIAIEFFGYVEKHYLPAIIFDTFLGSWPFLIIKFIIVLVFIWTVRGIKSNNLQNWLLWIVFLLGLATGTRDFLRLITKT